MHPEKTSALKQPAPSQSRYRFNPNDHSALTPERSGTTLPPYHPVDPQAQVTRSAHATISVPPERPGTTLPPYHPVNHVVPVAQPTHVTTSVLPNRPSIALTHSHSIDQLAQVAQPTSMTTSVLPSNENIPIVGKRKSFWRTPVGIGLIVVLAVVVIGAVVGGAVGGILSNNRQGSTLTGSESQSLGGGGSDCKY